MLYDDKLCVCHYHWVSIPNQSVLVYTLLLHSPFVCGRERVFISIGNTQIRKKNCCFVTQGKS